MKITRIDIWCTKIVQIKITALNTIKIQIKITCLIMMTERFLKGKNGIKHQVRDKEKKSAFIIII